MTQKELASVLEIREATVSAWLNEQSASVPKGDHLLRLPEILGVSGHWLLTGDGPMHAPSPTEESQRYRLIAAIVQGEHVEPMQENRLVNQLPAVMFRMEQEGVPKADRFSVAITVIEWTLSQSLGLKPTESELAGWRTFVERCKETGQYDPDAPVKLSEDELTALVNRIGGTRPTDTFEKGIVGG